VSRLESAIRRLMAQKSTLDWAAAEVAGRDGPVLELGLGNGRTYDHLRHILPNRPIYVFEREVAAHPDCVPPDDHLFLGDVMESLPLAAAILGPVAVLAHVDIGSGDKDASVALGARVAPLLAPLLAPGAIVVSDQPLPLQGARQLPLPDGVQPGRIHLLRTAPAGREMPGR
jgi:hypothetical protein